MTSAFEGTTEFFPDPAALSRHAADWMLGLAKAKKGIFTVCLSGGSTPQRLYGDLAGPPWRDRFPWDRTHWFWGDERFVPRDDALSNYRMASEALLSRVPIPAGNIHAIPTEGLSPDEAAATYERELRAFHGKAIPTPAHPLFDVTLLGLGPDGHTASLFPDTAVLEEREHLVAAVIGAKAEARITLTYPALESSRNTAFLVAGADKRPILDRLRRGDLALPAAHLHPVGALWLFADAAAGLD